MIHGVRVRGYGTKDLSWKVFTALDHNNVLEEAAKAAGVTGLKCYFDAERETADALDDLHDQIDELEVDEEISSREASRRRKAVDARQNEEGRWFPISDGIRTVHALLGKLGEDHLASSDLRELARLLKKAATRGSEFRLYWT